MTTEPPVTDAPVPAADAATQWAKAPGQRHENLTRDQARSRAGMVRDVTSQVHLDLDRGPDTFRSHTRLTFTSDDDAAPWVDLTAVQVERVELDGRALDPAMVAAPTRVDLPRLSAGVHHLEVVATMAYQHEGKGLHRFVDPTDDRVYLHSQFQPFDAHLVYACFDQPDLRTVFELTVDAPAGWVVVSNSPHTQHPSDGEAGRWHFAPTPRISPYVTAVVAGAYTGRQAAYRRADGSEVPLGLFVRRSLAEHLDTAEILEVTRQGLEAFERLFDRRYPFTTYDQLFVPEFFVGAMENPGCVTFSESYVFRSRVTDAARERRAETILHEMAHMWFGDLVTMRWWDDLWLNESFATFMASFVQATATRWNDAWVTFLDQEKAWARYQDQLPSTHPVADEMPDVESVHQNFDGITYAKGAAVLRQLVAWVGEDAFLAGCRRYFDRHAWGNTELTDFLGALEEASGRDLAAWRDEWLLTTGVTTLAPRIETGPDGTIRHAEVVQSAARPTWAVDDAQRPRARRHRLAVGLYDRDGDALVRTHRVELDVSGDTTPVPELVGMPSAPVLLVNDDDLTYAKVRLDPATAEALTDDLAHLRDPLARAQVWAATWEMVRDGELPARRFVALVRRNAGAEDRVGVLQRLLQRAVGAAERYGDPSALGARLAELAVDARAQLEGAPPGSDRQLAWARHWAYVARGVASELADVRALLDGELAFEGLELDVDLRWHLVTVLARAGAAGPDLIDAELGRDDTDLGQRQATTARAARPVAEAKEAAWQRLLGDPSLSHTMSRQLWTGFSQLDQGELVAPFVPRYVDALDGVWATRSLDWAVEFTAGMFPHAAASDELRSQVDAVLDRRDLPAPLRRVLLEERDTLVRTLDARALDASVPAEPAASAGSAG